MAQNVNKSEIFKCIQTHYHLSTNEIEFLDAYEDVNIKITTTTDIQMESNPPEFLLKLTKTDQNYIDFQVRIICHLQEHGIQTLKPVTTVNGEITLKHTLGTQEEFTVYMFEFVPGMTLKAAGNPDSLFSDIGRQIGKMDTVLKEFKEERTHHFCNDLWELTRLPEIQELMSEYCDAEMSNISQEIIDTYNREILPALSQFQKGFIHGDVNNCNIIVQKQDNVTPKYAIAAIIDFGDACWSYYVYELACIMADMMTSTFHSHGVNFVRVGDQILQGYKECFTLHNSEICHLRVIICIRLLQMYVLNSRASQQNPDNKYIALEIEESRKVCEILWNMTDNEFSLKFESL